MSDIDTAAADSLKVLDPERPIREADIVRALLRFLVDLNGTRWSTPYLDQSQGARVLCSSNRETCHEKDEHHWSIDGRGNGMRSSYLT